jgi:hypothetical protein
MSVGLFYCNGKNVDPKFTLTVVYTILIEASPVQFLVATVIMLKDPLFLPLSTTVY